MKDQHEKIKGYRDLSQEEIDLINAIKELAEKTGELCERLVGKDGGSAPDQRWVNIGKTDLQKGYMALVRSVAEPTTF